MKIIILLIFLFVLNIDKTERVYYVPFEIPGKQMAITIPPIGIFIESRYKSEGDGLGTILSHERIHWHQQYKQMGLIKFYYSYASEYIKYGRINNWMEEEARKLSNSKNK